MSYVKIYVFMICVLCIIDRCFCYKEFTLSDDEICSPIKKRELKIGNNKHSAIVVKEVRTFEHWDGYEFKCRFEIEAPSGDGLIAVIQNLYFRMNSDGTCLDYVQFRRRGPKFCGHISAFQSMPVLVQQIPDNENPSDHQIPENAYVDLKGEIDTLIYVDGKKLEDGQKLELEIAYTSYRDCSKGRLGYEPCDSRICIWKGLFNDSIVNCPSNCVDESGCFRSPNSIAIANLMPTLSTEYEDTVPSSLPSQPPEKEPRICLPETQETKDLSTDELQRLLILKQLELTNLQLQLIKQKYHTALQDNNNDTLAFTDL